MTAPAQEKSAVVAAAKEALARISATYQVPAYLGAPVEFEGIPGRVVGADPVSERVLVRLAGEAAPDLFHPRWHLIWTEENGPATAVPGFPLKAAPVYAWTLGEGQWSGV